MTARKAPLVLRIDQALADDPALIVPTLRVRMQPGTLRVPRRQKITACGRFFTGMSFFWANLGESGC
jgi:hypothetical protein